MPPEEAEEYLQKACAISEEQKYDEKFIEVMKLLSVLHPFKASHYYRQAIEHCHDQIFPASSSLPCFL